MSTTGPACAACGQRVRAEARFCDSCGAPLAVSAAPAEYKQVTVLIADVVRSMQLAARLDPERLREVMAAVYNRSAIIVQRCGGTVDKFTGDGIMALFGAPVALEDHALRGCLAALEIQDEMSRLSADVDRRDGVELWLRIGLNSGQVIAGEIDSGPAGYTAIGSQVGLAQRMESAAPPGGIMLSASTAALVENLLALDDTEMVSTKDSGAPLPGRRLIAAREDHPRTGPHRSTLVGRDWEMATITGALDRAITGRGAVVGVTGPPGIGKSRIVQETTTIAHARGIEVFTTYCESHTSEIPFHAVARLLRNSFRISELNPEAARARIRSVLPQAEPDDLILFDDLLGVREVDAALPDISADARQGRLMRLVNSSSLTRTNPVLYVIEDAHWIDTVSEAMIAEFASNIPRALALALVTYRPEYRGALTRVPNAHRLNLATLDDSESSAFVTELVGPHPSVQALGEQVSQHAAGNPFFAQEIVRDLAERGVLSGERGAYESHADTRDVRVPATVQATLAARVDRLDAVAKRTLTAASVIGSRFGADLLEDVLGETAIGEPVLRRLVDAELIDQVRFTPRAEYVFQHPLIHTVTYESQLKSHRSQLHRLVARAIENRNPAATDENAALIAEHMQAAGDLYAAYAWHMRAGTWATHRDTLAAATSWRRARDVADQLPDDDPDRLAMRIAPRTLLCSHAWRISGTVADTGFEELRDLTSQAGDKLSLAIATAGWVPMLTYSGRITESAQLAGECVVLTESIGNPVMTVALMAGPLHAKFQAGEAAETLRLANRVIELADGDPTMGNLAVGSPLALAQMFRAGAAMQLGRPRFREYYDEAIVTARGVDTTVWMATTLYKYASILSGVLLPDDDALRDTADALDAAERSGDQFAAAQARLTRGIVLAYRDLLDAGGAMELLDGVRKMAVDDKFSRSGIDVVDITAARISIAAGDADSAIALSRATTGRLRDSGDLLWPGAAISALVEALLERGTADDIAEAAASIDELAAIPTEPGFVLNEIPLLRCRALLARVSGERSRYREFRDRYALRAEEVGFTGHQRLAAEMD